MNLRGMFGNRERSSEPEKATPSQSERGNDRRSRQGAVTYAITVGGQTFPGLNKRDAVYQIVSHLCASGIHPDTIPKFPKRTQTQTWCSVEGNVDGATFRASAREQLTAIDKPIDDSRWFWKDEELIHAGNRTYAFTAQWGPTTEDALSLLQQTFPQAGISYRSDESA